MKSIVFAFVLLMTGFQKSENNSVIEYQNLTGDYIMPKSVHKLLVNGSLIEIDTFRISKIDTLKGLTVIDSFRSLFSHDEKLVFSTENIDLLLDSKLYEGKYYYLGKLKINTNYESYIFYCNGRSRNTIYRFAFILNTSSRKMLSIVKIAEEYMDGFSRAEAFSLLSNHDEFVFYNYLDPYDISPSKSSIVKIKQYLKMDEHGYIMEK